ncbi:MAG: hypothetical protein H0W78_07265 [Planctomycetes bacterium]|nr:hypothetical protein [Planctomycetota bacterium]
MSHSSRMLSFLLLVLLIGGHWGMLQVVAWTGMLIDYSRDNTFAEAVEMTFGGEYRCAICKQVDAGIAAERGTDERKAPSKTQKTVKLDAVVTVVAVAMPATTATVIPSTAGPVALTGIALDPLRRPPQTLG